MLLFLGPLTSCRSLSDGDVECVQAILAVEARLDEVNFNDLIRARRPT